jgi:DNA-binding transcriptional LysR family regulator
MEDLMDRVRKLELLVRSVEAGAFAKAARSLDLTPSAISHAIAELEKELGVTLLYRTTRQLRLTEDGQRIYEAAGDVLRRLEELERDTRRGVEQITGTLRIGLPVALSKHVIMPRLTPFLQRHPHLRLQFHVLWQPKEMHEEGIDLLLRVGELPESNLIARKIAELTVAVYGSPIYIKQAGTPKTPDSLLQHRCLVFKVPWMSKPIDQWVFERAGKRKAIGVHPTIVSYDREGLIEAACLGAGLMYMGCFDPLLIRSGRLIRVLNDWSCPVSYPVYAVYRKSTRMPAKLAVFLDFVAAAFHAFDPEELTLRHRKVSVASPGAAGRMSL